MPVGGDFAQTPGFNLNGIVAENGVLLVAQSEAGKLFRVDPATGVADEVDLGGATLSYPDGLELLGHTLYVARPFDNRVTVVKLALRLASGVVLGDLATRAWTSPRPRPWLRAGCGPSTCGSRRPPSRRRPTGSHSCHSAREYKLTSPDLVHRLTRSAVG